MPRIQWTGLPPALRDHLFDRLRERKIDLFSVEALIDMLSRSGIEVEVRLRRAA